MVMIVRFNKSRSVTFKCGSTFLMPIKVLILLSLWSSLITNNHQAFTGRQDSTEVAFALTYTASLRSILDIAQEIYPLGVVEIYQHSSLLIKWTNAFCC